MFPAPCGINTIVAKSHWHRIWRTAYLIPSQSNYHPVLCEMANFVVFTGMLAVIMAVWTLADADAMCRDSSDCAPNGCCTIPNVRYPTPTCNPYRSEGESCKPGIEPFSHKTSSYSATNVYSNLCPCAPGLACASGKCTKI